MDKIARVFMNRKFWENKRVLITGFEGFLGSNLTKELLKTKAKIVGLDIKTFRKETILSRDDYKRFTVYKGSVANFNLVKKILRKHSINVIFHLAAEATVGSSHSHPRKAFKSNITGTWEVLESTRNQGKIEAIVVASSDKAYGSHKKLPYREDAPLIANHPYDVSKSCADLIAQTYAYTYDLPIAVTRCGNIFGPGDFNFTRLIPDAIRSALKNRFFFIRSNGKFIRDYIYVSDIVDGYILLAEKIRKLKLKGEAFNFSDEKPKRVLEVVEKIYQLMKKEKRYKILNKAEYEIKNQYLSSKKSKRILGWKPRYSFESGLKETIKFLRKELL